MDALTRRVTTCRLICKMQQYPEQSNRLGLENKSYVREEIQLKVKKEKNR